MHEGSVHVFCLCIETFQDFHPYSKMSDNQWLSGIMGVAPVGAAAVAYAMSKKKGTTESAAYVLFAFVACLVQIIALSAVTIQNIKKSLPPGAQMSDKQKSDQAYAIGSIVLSSALLLGVGGQYLKIVDQIKARL